MKKINRMSPASIIIGALLVKKPKFDFYPTVSDN